MKHLIDIQRLPETLAELARLLNQPIFYGNFIQDLSNRIHINGKISAKPPLNQNIKAIIEDHNRGNVANRQYGLARLAMLILDLQQIEKYSKETLRYFQRVYKGVTENEYYGFRVEVDVTATLIINNISFINERNDDKFGDIRLDEFQPNTFLECTSCHIDKDKFSSFTYKIKSTIHKKLKKPYCNRDTALLMDITNIFHARGKIQVLSSKEELDLCISDIQGKSKFGSIILFAYLINKDLDEHRFQNLYFRYDHSNISSQLSLMLDKAFPIDHNSQPLFQVSFMGNY